MINPNNVVGDLNMALLKQHIAILQMHLESVVRVADSLEIDANMLENEKAEKTPEANAVEAATARARAAEEKLAKAIADLHFVMGGGDSCEVCATKCMMGVGNCTPVWRGEEA